jgi:hypothetical protein
MALFVLIGPRVTGTLLDERRRMLMVEETKARPVWIAGDTYELPPDAYVADTIGAGNCTDRTRCLDASFGYPPGSLRDSNW